MFRIVTRRIGRAATVGLAGAAFLCLIAILPVLSTSDSLATLDDDNTDDSVAAPPVLAPRCPTLLANGRSAVSPEGRISSPESDPSLPTRAPPRG